MRVCCVIFGLVQLIIVALACDKDNCQINLNSNSGTSIRLKSILSLGLVESNSSRTDKKIFWSFKRIYASPDSSQEISQLELMISLDSEVQDNLKSKYSVYLNNDSKFDLIVSNLSFADSGLYKCNLWNQKTIYYRLNVIQAIQQPVLFPSYNQMAIEGDKLTVKCVSKNAYPYATFAWFRDKQKIHTGIQTSLIDKETNLIESTVTIDNISSDLNGLKITCLTEQSLNRSVLSLNKSMHLNVGYRPKLALKILNNNLTLDLANDQNIRIFASDLDNLYFDCSDEANPSSTNKKWILNENKVVSRNTDRLTLSNVNLKVFKLTCLAENSVGRSELSVSIGLLFEPRIKLNKAVFEVNESTPFQLNCLYDSYANRTSVKWYKMHSNESVESSVASDNGLLDFKSIKMKENAGFYQCELDELVNDSFGIVRQFKINYKMELLVRFGPIMTVNYRKQAANSSSKNLNLSCVSMSYPEPKFEWFKNGLQLTNLSKYKINLIQKSKNLFESILSLNAVSQEDFDQIYECNAFNELGSSRIQIELVHLSRPDSPTELRSLAIGYSSVSVSWSPGFDGGLDQNFVLQLNETTVELNSPNVIVKGPALINITNLNINSIYSIRVMAKNQLGHSNWSDYVLIRTRDLSENERVLLPLLDSLFLNVPKNRLEFRFKSEPIVPICLRLSGEMLETFMSNSCIGYNSRSENKVSLDGVEIDKGSFDSKQVKWLKVDTCFQAKSTICSQRQMTAIIDTYNKISHLSLLKKDENSFDQFLHTHNLSVPVLLIIGISVCILVLVIILFVTIIFCIRKKKFKLCKSLLCQKNLSTKPFDEKIKKFLSDQNRLGHSKSFNIDIHSISAPVASTVSISGSQLTSSTSSENSNSKPTRRTFTAALTQTANNILHNSISRGKANQILVTEDDSNRFGFSRDEDAKLESATSSTAVSNCSSQNLHTPYLFTDYTLFDNQGLKCESSSGSNSDPIAINNSLTSNSASDSPIYGYNIAGATTAHHQSIQNSNLDCIFQVQQMNFHTQSSDQVDQSSLVRHQTASILNKQAKYNKSGETTESGYSTPSRPKKVIYEVIV